jgi:hypothetical protein
MNVETNIKKEEKHVGNDTYVVTQHKHESFFEKIFRPFFKRESTKVSFWDFPNVTDFLSIVSKGNEGILFLPIGKNTDVAEKIAIDLYLSNDETYKCYAAQLLGFIEDSKKHLFINFYRAEKQYCDSLPIDDHRRNNSHNVIEKLIISTVIRFDLIYQRYKNNKRPSRLRLGSDWINFLFEVVVDAINENKWNSYPLALSILSFHYYNEKWFGVLLAKYEEYIAQTTDEGIQANRSLCNEIKTRNGETEMFENLLNNVIIPKIDEVINRAPNKHEEEIINDIIAFFKRR